MRTLIAIVCVELVIMTSILSVSCTAAKNATTTTNYPDGRTVQDQTNQVLAFGGRGANSNRGTMWDNEKSFRDGALAVVTLGASYYGAVTTQATEATKQALAASAAKTEQAKIAADAALATEALKAKAAATTHAIGSGAVPIVAPITPP